MKRYVLLATLVAAVCIGACAGESNLPKANGEGTLRAINTIPTSPAISFLIEEVAIGIVEYKSASSPAVYDGLNYTFNFEAVLAGDLLRTRVASQNIDVVKDTDYTFIISGATAAPDITVWEGVVREWEGTETVFASRFGHTAASLGDIDVYFADPAIPPALGSQLGTLAFGEFIPAADFPEGDYVLTLTTAGDDTAILFQSDAVTLIAQSSLLFTVFDGDGNDLSPWAVRIFNTSVGGTSALADARFPPTLRFFHSSLNIGMTDVYVDDPLTVPLLEDHTFRDVTDDLPVSSGILPITYTTADNIGSILIDVDRTVVKGTQTHIYLIRTSLGTDLLIDYFPDRRSIETQANFTIVNTVPAADGLDVYFVPAGESIDEVNPLVPRLSAGSDPLRIPFVAGSYDIYVTVAGEKTELAGPIAFDAVRGEVYDAIIYENSDPTVVDFVFVPVP
jgi:hypothetical protein